LISHFFLAVEFLQLHPFLGLHANIAVPITFSEMQRKVGILSLLNVAANELMEIKVWEVFCRVFPKGRLSWTWPRHTCIPGSMQPTIHQREETTLDDFWKAKPQFTLNAQVRVIDEGLPMAEQMDSSSFRCRNIALEIFTISTYDIIL